MEPEFNYRFTATINCNDDSVLALFAEPAHPVEMII